MNALQAPGEYQSQYQSQIQGILDTINNRPAFNYQPENDQNYRVYRDLYTRMGERAAEDVQAQAAALTGGYGSSYGASAGQQAYQGYLAEMNNQLPALMQLAEQRYQNEIANDFNKLSALQGLEEYAYGQHRDQVGDFMANRDYLAGRYDTEYSKDYGQYRDDVADYENELNYLFQKYGALTEENMSQFMMELEQWENDREWYLNKYAMSPEEVRGGGGGGSNKVIAYTPKKQTQDDTEEEMYNKFIGNSKTPYIDVDKAEKVIGKNLLAAVESDPYLKGSSVKTLTREEEEELFRKYGFTTNK